MWAHPVGLLQPEEEGWREAFERLTDRFPSIAPERVAQVLRTFEGHAGSAAAHLRKTTGVEVKPPDPDDAEQVATLLSSPVIFTHICKEKFEDFDKENRGVLEWDQILGLTNELYLSFGLLQPAETHVRAFFEWTDEERSGILSESDFRTFFEQFLRCAYFDVQKLKYIVDKAHRQSAPEQLFRDETLIEVSSEQVEKLDSVRSDAQIRAEVVQQPRKNKREQKSQPPSEKCPSSPNRRRSKRDDHDGIRGWAPQESLQLGSARETYRCVAHQGMQYCKSPDARDLLDSKLSNGETVQALEHWIRTPNGWLRMEDSQGTPLLEKTSAKSRGLGNTSRENARYFPTVDASPQWPKMRSDSASDLLRPKLSPLDKFQTKGNMLPASRSDVMKRSSRCPEEWQITLDSAGGVLLSPSAITRASHAGKSASSFRD